MQGDSLIAVSKVKGLRNINDVLIAPNGKETELAVILQVLGFAVLFESVLLLLPMLVALIHKETAMVRALGITIAGTGIAGFLLSRVQPRKKNHFARDGLTAVGLIWLVLSAAGAIPFWISGETPSYVDSFFETVSGFTTTGATILTDIESLSRSAIFWRSLTHWVGGMGCWSCF